MSTKQYSVDDILRIAAFSDGEQGGNPAGVWLGTALPPADRMQRLAHAVGFSETAFAAPAEGKGGAWRVRYFAPACAKPGAMRGSRSSCA